MLRKKPPRCAVCFTLAEQAKCGGCGAPQPGFPPAPRVSPETPSIEEWQLAVRKSLVRAERKA